MNEHVGPIRPTEVVAYLRSHGWTVADDGYEGGALWEKQTGGGNLELFVPIAEGAPDYSSLLHDAVSKLSHWERRDRVYIFREMKETSEDVVRLRLAIEGNESGRLPLALAPKLFRAAHDITISAANAVGQRRPHYKKWTKAVHEFAQHAEIGQTEPGSYVV